MKELVEKIAKALVERPEQVHIIAVNGSEVTILELRAHPDDLGRVIGRDGHIASASVLCFGAGGVKLRKRFRPEIVDQETSSKAKTANVSPKQK